MTSLSIVAYSKTGDLQAGENLTLQLQRAGKTDVLNVSVGKYEKRPIFITPRLAEIAQYQSKAMLTILNAVSLAYADMLRLPFTVET